jgi:hypothetical protein
VVVQLTDVAGLLNSFSLVPLNAPVACKMQVWVFEKDLNERSPNVRACFQFEYRGSKTEALP